MTKLDGAVPETGEWDRFKLLVDAITDYAIYMLDPSGNVVTWNAGAERFKGYAGAEIIGRHFSEFYTPEDRAAGVPFHALRTAEAEGRFETEGWRVRKDGTRFWTHVVIDAIRTATGELAGFAKITRDLTERKRAEDALRQSENQFRLLVQSVTDYAIYMLDPAGRVSSWNAGAERIKGYKPAEIIGEHFSKFYQDEDRERGDPIENLKIAARDGRFENEGWRVRKDGSRFWAHVVIDAIRNDMGDLVGFAKITRDNTERQLAQKNLEDARESLFQAQKLEAIGQLTGGVAHDFNNLLSVVVGSLELLRKRLPQGDIKILSLVDAAAEAARRGATLTQRMLAFARKQPLELRPLDVGDLVRGMSELLQRAIGPSIEIDIRLPNSLPQVMSDSGQLETALLNLATNARDAMPLGGPLVISARPVNRASGFEADVAEPEFVCLSVTDRGEGMDEETLAKATEPFFTTKGVGKGTGLGLSMVQGLAAQSGGQLDIHSRIGEGTTVEIWLPTTKARDGDRRENTVVQQDVKSQRLRILAVDDDALVLMNTAAMLEDLGHVVIEAYSGDEALEVLAKDEEVDLVITDHAMPRMTGLQLATLIRAEWPKLPILMATGYAELPEGPGPELPRLSKPFGQIDLERAVHEVMRLS